jgi:uncharacterized protein YjdB
LLEILSKPKPKTVKNYLLLLFLICALCPLISKAQSDGLPRGAYDVPYKRYESEAASRGGSAALKTSPQYNMSEIASEASDQKYVSLPNGGSISWNMSNSGAGVTMRFTLPDAGSTGQSGSLDLYVNNAFVKTINLTSYWAWQYFNKFEHDPSNVGPKDFTFMRFDEVHFKLTNKLNANDVVRIQNAGSLEIGVDFIEVEEVPAALGKPAGYISVVDKGAIPNDGIDDQAAFNAAVTEADAANTGIYIPEGQFTIANCWRVSASNMGIKGAGMWYTNVHYSTNAFFSGGLMSSSTALDISDIYFSTNNNIRWENGVYRVYKGMMGSYGDGTKMQRLWIEHFECGMWIGDYDNTPLQHTTNLLISHCRIRNNYADGINLCQGTNNSIIEFCSVRNEGDDGLASWAAKDMGNIVECTNLEFRNNTIENNWRAGSIGIFGGSNHKIHHNYIKDGVAGSGIRFTTEFPGYHFENNTNMQVYENTMISCGTSTDLVDQEKGAIELYDAQGPIQNMTFSNNDIINAQRNGVILGAGTINNIVFNNLTINGTGLDGQSKSAFAGAYFGGYGVFCFSSSGTTTFNNLVMTNIHVTDINGQNLSPIYKGSTGYNLIVNSAPPVVVTGVSVSPTNATLAVGATQQLTPTVSPANATNKNVTYTSSNNGVATVSTAGLITAVASGTATITVTTVDQSKTATCAVTVSNIPVTGVTVSPTTAALSVGSTQQLTPTVSPSNASNKNVTYSTSSSSIATVSSAGLITAVAAGSATITVTTVDGAKTATCAVTVSNVAVSGVSVSPSSATIGVGGTQQLTPTISPSNATNKNVSYSSSNSSIATVNSSGLITGVAVGSATITVVTSDGAKTATCAVTVTSNAIAPWTSADVGSTALAGSATQSAGTYTIKGSGADAWDVVDAFQFVYQAVTGDMTMTARIVTEQNTNTYAKVGIDVRNALTANSSHAMNVLHANGALDYQYRSADGGTTASSGSVTVSVPYWVRIQRVGNTLTAYRSADGTTWTQSGSVTITMNNTVYVGMMVCSHDNTVLNTSTFSNVTLTASSNVAVTGVTVSPTSASVNVGATQQLTATVAPSNATNKTVTWSSSNSGIASVNSSGLVTGVAAGTATITVTTQDGGKTATSSITVNTTNVAVTGVTVSPTSASVNVGATQQLTATVAPSNATNKSVTWSSSNSGVASVNSSGLVSGVSSGSATITVTTVDGGKTATSAITVNVAAGTLSCKKSSVAITVNGSLSETSWSVVTNSITKTTVGTGNNTATFGVLWDNTNLYIGAKVLDANLFSDSPDSWDDDAIEIYIDANNNKLTSYDGLDNQIIKNYNKSAVFTKLGITGLQHAWAAISGGYSIEIAVPWSQLGISAPAQGTTIGFDIGYDDDDNGGARDAQVVWNGTINNYQNTSGFGSLVLNNTTAREASEEVVNNSDSNVSIWPTIVESELYIQTDGSYKSVEVIDVLGRVHRKDESIQGKQSITMDLSNLASGIHFVRLRSAQQAKDFRIIKK